MCATKVSLQRKDQQTIKKFTNLMTEKDLSIQTTLTNLLEKCQSKNQESWFKNRITNDQQKRKTLRLRTKKIKM